MSLNPATFQEVIRNLATLQEGILNLETLKKEDPKPSNMTGSVP